MFYILGYVHESLIFVFTDGDLSFLFLFSLYICSTLIAHLLNSKSTKVLDNISKYTKEAMKKGKHLSQP
jgi:hypothetical protein